MAETDPLHRRIFARIAHPPPVVAIVTMSGLIGSFGPLRRGLTLETLDPVLRRAFSLRRLAGVAIRLNSPGGSPVQSALIAGRIRQLADARGVPVYAFAEDVCASGGYWIACAADHIYADASSIVGSIGVISAGFGFPALLDRLGVERRVHTAGARKGMLDPFRPEHDDDVRHLEALQADMHAAFIDHVRARRAERLRGSDDELFSGSFWTGTRALALGLIDGLGALEPVLRQRIQQNIRFKRISPPRSFWRQRSAAGAGLIAADVMAELEERLAYARFRL